MEKKRILIPENFQHQQYLSNYIQVDPRIMIFYRMEPQAQQNTQSNNTNNNYLLIDDKKSRGKNQKIRLLQKLFQVLIRQKNTFVEFIGFNISQGKMQFAKQASFLSQNIILTLGENNQQLRKKIQRMKKRAQGILKRERLNTQSLQICAVKRNQNKYYLRIDLKAFQLTGYKQGIVDQLNQQVQFIKLQQDLQIKDKNIIKKLQNQYQKANDRSYPGINQILQLQQSYYKNSFQNIDKLVQKRQFQGQDRFLIKTGKYVTFEDYYQGQKYKLDNFYSCQQCNHFKGYCTKFVQNFQIQKKQGYLHRCDICGQYQYQIKLDVIMDMIMKHRYNPQRKSILYFPIFNRFKIPSLFGDQFQYKNFYHFRDTILPLNNLKFRAEVIMPQQQTFDLSYTLGDDKDKKFVIKYPARGKFCKHMAFCDLRQLYITKKKKNYTCPICSQQIIQQQIIYLQEFEILLKLATKTIKKKSSSNKDTFNYVQLSIDHQKKTVFFKFQIHYSHSKQQQQIKRIYKTLIDPLYYYDQTQLGLSDQQIDQMIEDYNWPKQFDYQSMS